MRELVNNPGSYNDFIESRGLANGSPEADLRYSEALGEYRGGLALYQGITLEQLHDGQWAPVSAPILDATEQVHA